ncbi:MAG TPA: efflux RND transporter periplasmic adaptor subunit [Bacteroidales bacterium]|nr:efflux RND transporter periplasmic adaptor subunit [Bacteroidales bacterium]
MYFKLLFTSLIGFVLAGCNHSLENEIHAEPEEVKVQYTAYSERYELFAEADPFVVGQMSNVLSHFSSLPEFTAVSEGPVTLKLIINGRTTEQTLESPTRKGIYSFDIKPEISGDGTMEYLVKTDSGDYRVIIPDIKVYDNTTDAIAAAEKNVISKANTYVFTKEQSWKIDFSTAYPEKKPFGQVIKTTAQVQSDQGDEMLVTAKTGGVISLSGKTITEGIKVSEGQPLLTIKGSGLAENNSSVRYAEARNNFEKAKSDYERTNVLAADKIVSEKQLLEARTLYENTKSVFDNLNQDFNASGQAVTSPMTGFIKQLYVKNGQYAEAGQPVILISQNKSLLLRAEVQQKYAKYLYSIYDANIRTIEDNRTYTLEELNGRFLSTGKTTTPDSYMIPITLQINNAGSFIPGSFVELYLKTLTNSQALIVPNSAILEEQGAFFVFVQLTPEIFEKREIKTGVTDGIYTEIIRGLSDNERIVTSGAIFIKLAQATGTLDAHSGHVH